MARAFVVETGAERKGVLKMKPVGCFILMDVPNGIGRLEENEKAARLAGMDGWRVCWENTRQRAEATLRNFLLECEKNRSVGKSDDYSD